MQVTNLLAVQFLLIEVQIFSTPSSAFPPLRSQTPSTYKYNLKGSDDDV
jgi:hypothetical protein